MLYFFAQPADMEADGSAVHIYCSVKNADGTITVADYALCARPILRDGHGGVFAETLELAADSAEQKLASGVELCPDCAEILLHNLSHRR